METDRRLTVDNGALYKKLAKIAIPISIQGVVSATLGLVDNLMVGSLGEAELAAVGIATQLFHLHYMLLFGFISGTATFMAQFYGTKDFQNIRKVLGFAMTIALAAGIVFFVLGFGFTDVILRIYTDDPALIALARPYVKICSFTFFTLAFSFPMEMGFKTTQQTKVPMVISIVVFSTNVCLNYILIFGEFGAPALGVAGAAVGTAIARLLEVGISMTFAARKSNCFHGPIESYFGWNREMVIRMLKNSAPTTLNEFMWQLGQSMYVAAFARIGTTAYAAFQAAASINSLFTHAAFSIGDATLILIGEKLGEGKKDEAYVLGKKLLKIGAFFGLILGGMLILSAMPLVNLFNLSALGKVFCFRILLVYGLTMWLGLYNGIQITGTLRGGGDTQFAMIAEVLCVWIVAVPLAFVSALAFKLPIFLAVLVVKLEDAVKCIILTKRFLSKKWMNNVITGL